LTPPIDDKSEHSNQDGLERPKQSIFNCNKLSSQGPDDSNIEHKSTNKDIINNPYKDIYYSKDQLIHSLKTGNTTSNVSPINTQNIDHEILMNKARILSVAIPTQKKGNFPYSRYCDPITPKEDLERDLNIEKAINIEKDLILLNSSKGCVGNGTTGVGGDQKEFELSASSYKYAPSAQEIEASVIKQLINQQQQNQEYYSYEHYGGPLTVANIGGVKRSHEENEKNNNLKNSKKSNFLMSNDNSSKKESGTSGPVQGKDQIPRI
jgi:hypothetical protein